MKVFFALVLAAVLVGCSQTDNGTSNGSVSTGSTSTAGTTGTTSTAQETTTTASTTGTTGTPEASPAANEKPPVDRRPKDGEEVGVLDTSMGKIVVMFFPDKAPNHVKNFKKLAEKGFYDGTKFHRVIPGFMIQGGDPNTKTEDKSSWGNGGPGYNLKAEFNDVHHARGILSMARTQDPNGAGSQFFIVVGDSGFLDKQYTVFGQVLSGMDVADKIVNVPTVGGSGPDKDMPNDPPVLKSVKIVKWPVK